VGDVNARANYIFCYLVKKGRFPPGGLALGWGIFGVITRSYHYSFGGWKGGYSSLSLGTCALRRVHATFQGTKVSRKYFMAIINRRNLQNFFEYYFIDKLVQYFSTPAARSTNQYYIFG
jgi:hypothetical protein